MEMRILCGIRPVSPRICSASLCAQGKRYTAAAWTGKRNMVGLAKDMHDALYTCKLALPGVLETHGENFVPIADGSCPSAIKLYQHVLYSQKGGV